MKKIFLFLLFLIIIILFLLLRNNTLLELIDDLYSNDSNNLTKTLDENENISTNQNSKDENDHVKLSYDYEKLKTIIQYNRDKLGENYNQIVSTNKKKEVLNETKKFLFKSISEDIIPYWIGTEWDYNGFTEKPQEGNIACGYFISTVLLHSGFNVERFKLAQQPSSLIIKTMCMKNSIKTFTSIDSLKEYLLNNSNSIYIVGLDNHVGFIEKKNEEIHFIHSSYLGKKSVQKEPFDQSITLSLSEIYMVGNLLDNIPILQRWLGNEKIITKLY